MMKYSYKGDKYSSHSRIIEIVRKSGKKLKILDVGCASGYIGKELGKDYYLIGIEEDRKSARIANKFYNKLFIIDIEKEDFRTEDEFDIIILGDVLEHLKDPLGVLIKMKKFLKAGGQIIISLPNIAFIFFRVSLLFGNFDYMDKGPMDKGHLRFFTLKTSNKLVRDAGLRIENIYFIPIPLPLIFSFVSEGNIFYLVHIINNLITQLWKKMFTYQFVIVASK